MLILLTNEKCDVKDSNWPGVLVGTFGELFIKSVISKSINIVKCIILFIIICLQYKYYLPR